MSLKWIIVAAQFFAEIAIADETCRQRRVSGERILAAGHELMNVFYQNPKASSLPPYDTLERGEMRGYSRHRNERSAGSNSYVVDFEKAMASQYYVNCSAKAAKDCTSVCSAPPTYVWGGMGWYEETRDKSGKARTRYSIFANHADTNSLSKHAGLDCSGLMFAVFANAGLRVSPDRSKPLTADVADNTPARSYLNTDSPESCFTEVPPARKFRIQKGDLIVWRKHMAMVDELGKDPFGLANARTAEDCTIEKIDPKKFTLVIYNSKGGQDLPSDEDAARYEANPYYREGLAELKRMKERFDCEQGTKKDCTEVDPKKPQLTGVGVGISRMPFRDFVLGAPGPTLDLVRRLCLAKVGAPLPDGEPLTKVVRHLASSDKPVPCGCYGLPSEKLVLDRKVDEKTAKIYCSKN